MADLPPFGYPRAVMGWRGERLLVTLFVVLVLACKGDAGGDGSPGPIADAARLDDGAPVIDGPPPDSNGCPDVAAPEPVSDLAIAGESPAGWHETTTANGFNDDYLYDATGYLKVGVRREWGGSIIFFGIASGYGAGTNPTNAIDANDTGREVQVAFYDPDRLMQGCAWNASCAATPTTCPASITYLGWDPVQGGNRCNVGSGVESVEFVDGALKVTTNPLFWNPNWDRTDCVSEACSDPTLSGRRSDVRVVQALRFVAPHVVQLDYTVVNLADLAHAATGQEMPTMYTANGNGGPDLWRVFNSDGTEIPVDTPAGGDGFYYENFTSPGGWAALQDDTLSYGVGLYSENRLTGFQAWQLRSLPFNNVRAQFAFGLPAFGTVRARAYLVLGDLSTISSQIAWLDGALAPFGVIDTPAADAVVSGGSVPVSGWALDNHGVTGVELFVDGVSAGVMTYGASRPDVCLVWPGYPGCTLVGYTGTLSTSGLTPCGHLLEVRASDAAGNVRTIARRRVFVAP